MLIQQSQFTSFHPEFSSGSRGQHFCFGYQMPGVSMDCCFHIMHPQGTGTGFVGSSSIMIGESASGSAGLSVVMIEGAHPIVVVKPIIISSSNKDFIMNIL